MPLASMHSGKGYANSATLRENTSLLSTDTQKGTRSAFLHLAADLVRLNVEIIVVGGGNATLALKSATKTIPIVMTAVSDPVGAGLLLA